MASDRRAHTMYHVCKLYDITGRYGLRVSYTTIELCSMIPDKRLTSDTLWNADHPSTLPSVSSIHLPALDVSCQIGPVCAVRLLGPPRLPTWATRALDTYLIAISQNFELSSTDQHIGRLSTHARLAAAAAAAARRKMQE